MSSKRNESSEDDRNGAPARGSWEGSAPARSKKKDAKRVAKAQERLRPSDSISEACNRMDSLRTVGADGEDGTRVFEENCEHFSRWEKCAVRLVFMNPSVNGQ
jgi:hypothetical protein